jgi:subtilisin family serine protease
VKTTGLRLGLDDANIAERAFCQGRHHLEEANVLGLLPASPAFDGHHQGMLIVRLHATAAALSAHAPGDSTPEGLTPGIAALHGHDERGGLKRLSSLAPGSRARPHPPGRRVLAAAGAAGAERSSSQRAGGSLLLELHDTADLDALHGALSGDPHVEWVGRVPARYVVGAVTHGNSRPEPPSPGDLWNLQRIGLAEAARQPDFKDAVDVRVGVIDTGAQPDHPGLVECVSDYEFDHHDVEDAEEHDIMGHGTHVSGVLGARRTGATGSCGVCRCNLTIWKVYRNRAEFTKSVDKFLYPLDPVMYRRALAELAEEGVSVLNLSLGGVEPPDPVERELYDHLIQSGTAVVAAMGNDRANGSRTAYPAALPGVIAVGAIGRSDRVWSGSSSGEHIALCAPGADIWSTVPTYPGQLMFDAVTEADGPVEGKAFSRPTGYVAWPGTSVATPHVAAAAALLLAKHGRLSGSEVREQLIGAADRVPAMGGASFTPNYGAGCLNLERLLST